MPPGGKALAYFIVQLIGNTSLLSAGSLPSMQTNSYSMSTISTTAIVHSVTNKQLQHVNDIHNSHRPHCHQQTATACQRYPQQPSSTLSPTNSYSMSTISTTAIVHTVTNKQLQNIDDIHNNDRPDTVNNKQLQNIDDIHNNHRPDCHQQTATCQRYSQQPSSTVNDFTNH